jgi:aryl-alcohol dehydrogenase-like predicted oxidoreductase
MEYRTLGASGCVVSTFALGTMTFGTETDEAGAHAQLDRFVEAGGTLVDTADVYSDTVSEAIIGRWLADRSEARDQVVLATKGRFSTGPGANDLGSSRRHLSTALDASLKRLGIDTVDLYQVHAWDPITPLEETLRFLDDAVHAGKVRYVGLSNFTGWQIQKAVGLAQHGARDRVGDPSGLRVHRARRTALVAARWRLADREVSAGHATIRRDSARGGSGPRGGGLRAAQPAGAHLGGHRRGARDR